MGNSAFEPIEHSGFFPAKVFVTAIDNSGYHWHYDYELVVVLKGHLQVLCKPNPFAMGAGDIFMVNSKVVHGYRGYGENLCLFIQFSPSLLEVEVESDIFYHFYLNSTVQDSNAKFSSYYLVCSACRVGLHSRREKISEKLLANSELYALLAMLLEKVPYEVRRYSANSFREPEDQLILKISHFIDENCNEELLVDKICQRFGLSKKTLYRYSKSMLGLTTKEMIDIARIEKAKEQLRSGKNPISLICYNCGYSSETTFYRIFKKIVGVTPGEYRCGEEESINHNIQGYMAFNSFEADRLLENFSKGDSSINYAMQSAGRSRVVLK